jgi:gluconate 2-dehydrogenase gamma chain
MKSPTDSNSSLTINRRDAIKRTAMLLGAAVSSSTIAGCMGEDRNKLGAGLDWKPQFLNNTHAKLVSAASELILPRTDTPGAQDVGVPQLIDVLYGKYMDDAEKKTVSDGLSALDAAGFGSQAADEQTATLVALGKTNKQFVTKLREAIITGYFTSEEVCKNVTSYDPVPGAYVGCVPISETGNVIMSEPR